MSCFLCESVGGKSEAWYDETLWQSKHSFVVAAVGPLAVGHVLISPIEHTNAVQRLPFVAQTDFTSLLSLVKSFINTATEKPVTVFEHSAPSNPDSQRSACIDHAHIHVVPGNYEIGEAVELPQELQYQAHDLDLFYTRPAPWNGYVMLAEPGRVVRVSNDVGQPQFLRRALFAAAGRGEEWDYALFPHEEITAQTIELFKQGH